MFQQFNAVNSFRVFYEIMFRNMEERRRNKHCIEEAKKIHESFTKEYFQNFESFTSIKKYPIK